LVLSRGECVAIMVPNGAGKTSLLRTLLGEIPPYSGEARLGANLSIGYFAQSHEELNPMRSVLEELSADNPDLLPAEARSFLARFLFRGDDVFKTVESLSGGERSRLALAKLLMKDANLFLLDEPTNHLDIPSQEVLQSALAQFEGTILLITHDRYLVNALATQLWMISPDEAALEVFLGDYSQYLEARQQKVDVVRAKPSKPEKAKSQPSRSKTRMDLEKVEASIADLEMQLRQLAQELAEVGTDVERVRQLGLQYAELEQQLNEQIMLWERLAQLHERA
jgi:ATP-binding cassette subfamily F protein 3